MSYCVNCGTKSKITTSICQNCFSDPKIPNEIIDKIIYNPQISSPKYVKKYNLESSGESSSLAFAIISSILIGILFLVITLGLFLFYFILGLIYLRIKEIQIKSNLIKISQKNYCQLFNLTKVAAYRLQIFPPPIFVQQNPMLNAYTSGFWGNHWIVLYSSILERLSPDELLFVLGHEMGHIKREHATWLNLISPAGKYSIPLISEGMRIIFNNWLLKADYSADRAGLIASGSLKSSVSALLKLTASKTNIDINEYLSEFEKRSNDPLYKISEYFGNHPFIPNRIKRIQEFAKNKPELSGG